MSSFYCPKCNKPILDTPKGYIGECEHYKINKAPDILSDMNISGADVLMAIFGYKRIEVKQMTKPKLYMFKGRKILATSKAEVLRKYNVPANNGNMKLVARVKKANG